METRKCECFCIASLGHDIVVTEQCELSFSSSCPWKKDSARECNFCILCCLSYVIHLSGAVETIKGLFHDTLKKQRLCNFFRVSPWLPYRYRPSYRSGESTAQLQRPWSAAEHRVLSLMSQSLQNAEVIWFWQNFLFPLPNVTVMLSVNLMPELLNNYSEKV